MRVVFVSNQTPECYVVRASLCDAGFDAALQNQGANMLWPGAISVLDVRVVVPDEQAEAALEFLRMQPARAEPVAVLGGLAPDSICAVHEQPAIAVCDRCGTFLCASCGALGSPAVCEDCLAVPEPPRTKRRWVKATASIWLLLGVGLPLVTVAAAMVGGALRMLFR